MDVDERDLPDTVLNVYLQEAFDRTMAMSNHWPRSETTWRVALIPGLLSVTLPPDLNTPSLTSVLVEAGGYRLTAINHELAEMNYANLNNAADTNPLYFSVWGNEMFLWPRISKAEPLDLIVRGYRQPVWDNAASTIPDLDPRLHVTLAYFALSLAYAQQEDDVLEAAYLARWNRDLMQQIKTIMEPVHARPLVMHGGSPVGGVPSYVVFPPGP